MWYLFSTIVKPLSRILGGSRVVFTRLILSLALLALVSGAQAQLPNSITFSPTVGAPGTSVHITGNNFSTAVAVTFNTVPAVFTIENANSIYATVPEGAFTGQISVNNQTGGGSSVANFTVSPRLTELTPGRGLTGTNVVVKGANLVGTTAVYFGDIPAAFLVTSDSQLTAQVPTGATNAPVKIVTPAGTASTTNTFLVTGAPLVTSFTPYVALRGQTIIVEGENFGAVTNVLCNGVAVQSGSQVAFNQIQITIPPTATTGPIEVQSTGGSFLTSSNLITGPAPIVTGFSPAGASAGTPVTITGVGFSGTSDVKFNGTSVTSGNVTADTQIQTSVPAGATTGPIKVFVGSSSFTTSSNFVVGPLPKITSVNVNSGSVGNSVAISGENLLHAGGSSEVYIRFNGVQASYTVTGSGGSQISATIPVGATSGFITASNSLGIATSPEVFTVTGTAPVILDFFPKGGAPGSTVTLYGFGFSGTTAVKLNGKTAGFSITSTSGTNQISATLPSDATTGAFTVTTAGGTATSSTNFFVWPRITGFSPPKATAGSAVVISGANFTTASEVRLMTPRGCSPWTATARSPSPCPPGARPRPSLSRLRLA